MLFSEVPNGVVFPAFFMAVFARFHEFSRDFMRLRKEENISEQTNKPNRTQNIYNKIPSVFILISNTRLAETCLKKKKPN